MYCWLGRLNLTFDDNGDLLSSFGQPILLDNSVAQDEDILRLLEVYRPAINEINGEIVGTSLVTLDNNICRSEECNFGNLVADAYILYKASVSPVTWTEAPIGLVNGGGIRTSIKPGDTKQIKRGDILAALPFEKQTVSLKITGADLVKTLELGIRSNGETSSGEFLQVSGIKVVYDKSKPSMSRVVSVKVRCGNCSIPTYEDIDLSKNYTIVTTSFLADGNDGFYVLKDNGMDRKNEDLGDVDVLVWYLDHYSPVYAEVSGRISFINNDNKNNNKNNGVVFSSFKMVTLFLIAVILNLCVQM